jgi:hypothetical protein
VQLSKNKFVTYKEVKSDRSGNDILGASSSATDGSPAKRESERERKELKYQTDFLTFGFTYQMYTRKSFSLCFMCVKFMQTTVSTQEICEDT